MTKAVRIENADTSAYRVVVQIWDKSLGGGPDVRVGDELVTYKDEGPYRVIRVRREGATRVLRLRREVICEDEGLR